MKWMMPKVIKVYEALGAIGDRRLEIAEGVGKLYSSSGNKYYTINYSPEKHEVYANDNASFFAGYLGYPAIAYLMQIGLIFYHQETAEALSDIKWKDINQKNKNDFDKTMVEIDKILQSRGLHPDTVRMEAAEILRQVEALNLQKPAKKTSPPKGY